MILTWWLVTNRIENPDDCSDYGLLDAAPVAAAADDDDDDDDDDGDDGDEQEDEDDLMRMLLLFLLLLPLLRLHEDAKVHALCTTCLKARFIKLLGFLCVHRVRRHAASGARSR